MRYVTLIARILLGLPFVVFGTNGVLWSLFDKAFMQPMIGMVQVVSGLDPRARPRWSTQQIGPKR